MEMALTEDDDVVETLPPYGSHEAFSIRILPRRSRCGENFVDTETVDPTAELVAEDAVAIAEQVLGRGVFGERLDDLLGGPGSAGVLGDAEVKNAAPVVSQDEEDIQNPKRRGGYREEIDRCQRADVVVEEGAPGLGGRLARLGRHEAGHASLADVDAELEQLSVNPRRAPSQVGFGHLADESSGLLGDAAIGRAAGVRLPSPEKAKTGAVPADHGVWLDDDQDIGPARPEAGKDQPERAVAVPKAGAARCAPQVRQLLAQSQVLDRQIHVGTEGGTQGSKKAQDQSNHLAMMHDGALSRTAWLPRHPHPRETDGADDLLARHRCLPSRSSSAAFSARWYSITRAWWSPNHIPIHAAKNCSGRGSDFSVVAVFAVRPIRPFYAPRSGL